MDPLDLSSPEAEKPPLHARALLGGEARQLTERHRVSIVNMTYLESGSGDHSVGGEGQGGVRGMHPEGGGG
jgi:hypothetical protein